MSQVATDFVEFRAWEETSDPEETLRLLKAAGIAVVGYDSDGDTSGGQEYAFTYLIEPFEDPYNEEVLDDLDRRVRAALEGPVAAEVRTKIDAAKRAIHALYTYTANTDEDGRSEAIEGLTEILALSRERLALASRMSAMTLAKGDRVQWNDRQGKYYESIVERVNRKTVTLIAVPDPQTNPELVMARCFPHGVRVPFTMLS